MSGISVRDVSTYLGMEIRTKVFGRYKVPDFFIRFLTTKGNIVFDPFAGSNVVGMLAEKHGRKWISSDLNLEYVVGSAFRFNEVGEKVFKKYNSKLRGA